MDEINFAEQNINAAQDRTQSDQNNARLIASGIPADDVARMKDEDKQKALADLDAMAPKPDPNSFAGYLDTIGNFVGGGMGTVLDLALGVGGVAVGAVGILAGLAGMPVGGGNPPTPPNAGVVATDDPVRRKEDEEGGEIEDSDTVDNSLIDGMNPDRREDSETIADGIDNPLQDSTNSDGFDQINTFDGESNSEAGVGGFEGPVFDSDVDGRSYDPLDGEKGGGDANPFNPDSKLNKVMEDLKGKSPAEIKKYFSNLSPSEINQLVKDGKNLPGPLKATETVITKSEKIAVKEREIDPSKEADVRKINDKVESFISQQLLKNYSDKLNAHNANYDSAFGKYEQTATNSETIRIMGESIQRLDSDSPLRKQLEATREFFMATSSSDGGVSNF